VRVVNFYFVDDSHYYIKVNNSPQRGLRQGDPLSPYLFILCAEGLSTLLQRAQMMGKICQHAPSVNHLFFADDSQILMKAEVSGAQELLRILEVYQRASEQVINKDKSYIMFSPNISQHVKIQMKSKILKLQVKST